jgi:hypothetical protein
LNRNQLKVNILEQYNDEMDTDIQKVAAGYWFKRGEAVLQGAILRL